MYHGAQQPRRVLDWPKDAASARPDWRAQRVVSGYASFLAMPCAARRLRYPLADLSERAEAIPPPERNRLSQVFRPWWRHATGLLQRKRTFQLFQVAVAILLVECALTKLQMHCPL